MYRCRVTNLRFGNWTGKVNATYQVPADVNEVLDWINEYEPADEPLELTDAEAYAIFIRSCLMYNHDVFYDFEVLQKLDPNDVGDWSFEQPFYADLADIRMRQIESKTVKFSMHVPTDITVDLTKADCELYPDDPEQAMFEYLINNLDLNIVVE